MAYDNTYWTQKMDEEVMSWVNTSPQDWHVGSKCQVYLWGSGRNGQLAEIGNLTCPVVL